MFTITISLLFLQSTNLNPGPYTSYNLEQATQVWERCTRSEAESNFPTKLGVSSSRLAELRRKCGVEVVQPDLDHRPTTVDVLALKIDTAIRKVLDQEKIDPASALGVFLRSDAMANWVRSHVPYNTMLEPGQIAKAKGISLSSEREIRMQFWQPDTLLKKNEPSAVCAGMSRLTYHLGRSLKLPLYNVQGYTRGALQVNGTEMTNPVNHSWNLLIIDTEKHGRIILSTDPTQARVSLALARSKSFVWQSPYAFPSTREEVAFFNYAQYVVQIEDFPSKLPEFQPSLISEKKWREMGSITAFDRARGQILASTKAATINVVPG